MAKPPWRIIPRPLLETILTNYSLHPRHPQPLLLHGPPGSGKSSLLLHRLIPSLSSPPHFISFIDFSSNPVNPIPILESSLESLTLTAIRLGAVSSKDIFAALRSSHGISTALKRISKKDGKVSDLKLWHKAVFDRIGEVDVKMIGGEVGSNVVKKVDEGEAFVREGVAAMEVAKEVIGMGREWRKKGVRRMVEGGGVSRTLVSSATDWPILLVELLSKAAQVDFFQPKLVINNIDVLRKATTADSSSVPAAMYHDSFIWRLIALGVNERCMPVILATSDSYYSYQAFVDLGFPDIFLSRETFGWTSREAKLHMVPDYFSETEWKVIDEVLGPNPRHLSELYALKQSTDYQELMQDSSSFEDIVDAYLAYLQVTLVNPAVESAIGILQKFASDVRNGRIQESRLQFGSPWRHPPSKDDPVSSFKWAKIQLMDFVQSLVNTEFGVNYLADYSLEILDDPSAVAMMEVGLLYAQRDPSFIRPISKGIQRCLARWLVQEKMQMSFRDSIPYLWQRFIRGRSYRHLMKELGYK